mmetsp:Transcript_26631/g.79134  ORF Transcript_26631/g.79134 Transcript_26631/m.79134 type:complete len:204 (+) Transcript_26631:1907-2518(+)
MMWAPASWRSPPVGDLDNMERLQSDLEGLFAAHGVDVVVQGHEHAYARTCMLRAGGKCADAGADTGADADADAGAPHAGGGVAAGAANHESAGLPRRGLPTSAGTADGAAGRVSAAGNGAGTGTVGAVAAGDAVSGRAPVYVLAGHAGAGFTHGFPAKLPEWVRAAQQDRNGYLRFTANFSTLSMEAVSTDDGSIMDAFQLTR